MKFEEMKIDSTIKHALKDIGFSETTEVQERAIPLAIEGKDLIVRSQTGTGKTAAFGISLIEKAIRNRGKSIVLAPTRELAIQIFNDLKKIAKNSGIKIAVVYGGEEIEKQIKFLSLNPSIIIATPGRFIDHINRGNIDFNGFNTVVLDEADRMLDMGFVEDIREILSYINIDQLLLFSATLNEEIMSIIEPYASNPIKIEIGEEEKAPLVEEEDVIIKGPNKFMILLSILKENREKTIIFLSTRKAVESLYDRLKFKRIKCAYLHGGLRQKRRENIMRDFKEGKFNILIATDVAARGLHIDNIGLVINYHEAGDEKTHIHRVGRTGRMGKKGKVINFIDGRKIV